MKLYPNALPPSTLICIMLFHAMVSLHLFVPRPFVVDAQAPASDLCQNAYPILIKSSPVPVTFNTTYATKDVDVTNDCVSGGPPNNPGIWLNFTGTGERIIARACDTGTYSYPYASMSIFTGGCNATARKCVAANYDGGCGEEIFYLDTTLGTAYHALVQSRYSERVDVSIFTAPPAPANDLCINAQPIVIGSSPVPAVFNTTYATKDVDVTNACLSRFGSVPGSPGIWFNFTGTGGPIVARACGRYQSNTVISIFTGGCNATARQCVTGTSNTCQEGRFVFDSKLGTAYHVLVQSSNFESVDVSIFSATSVPTKAPTKSSTKIPTRAPGIAITKSPTKIPTRAPAKIATKSPAKTPTRAPAEAITKSPMVPIKAPSNAVPSEVPKKTPTTTPVVAPTNCGLFGLNFFCPKRGKCGFLRRLLKKRVC